MRITKAIYHQPILPEHRENPLIAALPIKVDNETLIELLSCDPPHSPDERLLPAMERIEYLARIKDFRQVLPIHLKVFRAIELAIKEGYSSRNPFSATTNYYLHYHGENLPEIKPLTGDFKPKGSGITVIGASGVGKTSMLQRILGYYSDTIIHTLFKDQLFGEKNTQVPWVMVDCPSDGSVKALCRRIMDEIDSKTGDKVVKMTTIDALIIQIEARIKSCALGLLVIDEMQYLVTGKEASSEKLMNFLQSLINKVGIPVLFCANPPFDKILSRSFRTARRAENNGYFEIERLKKNEPSWGNFIHGLWQLQWTKVETPLTKSLSEKMYERSMGNFDLAVRIYREAQRLLIHDLNDDESITETIIDIAANNTQRLTGRHVDQLKKEEDEADALALISRRRRGIIPQEEDSKTITNTVIGNDVIMIPGDLKRCQHPEFRNSIAALLKADILLEYIDDPDLIRRACLGGDPLDILYDAGVLLIDPLTEFA